MGPQYSPLLPLKGSEVRSLGGSQRPYSGTMYLPQDSRAWGRQGLHGCYIFSVFTSLGGCFSFVFGFW